MADAGSDATPIRRVTVTLDGVPVAGATVMQGGNPTRWVTDLAGSAFVSLDPTIAERGEMVLLAAHPEARTASAYDPGPHEVTPLPLELFRFAPLDNESYVFHDPGEPTRRDSTAQCAHCHVTINADWVKTPHRFSAQNVVVQDLYAGTASAVATSAECVAAGGVWAAGTEPGTKKNVDRCYIGDGVLPALNPECGPGQPCDAPSTTGACADCHAPGMDGKLGGRNLLEASGHAFEYGIHCDVCHRVESVDLDAPPGVAGRLRLLRPSEASPSPGLGQWRPIMFGPWPDVANPLMGGVEREHFHDGTLCAGCHQLDQPVLVPGVQIDTSRWPEGTLPVHSTYAEWAAGAFSGAPCPSCHMPPDPSVGNGADLYNEVDGPEGIATGWLRAPGSVRRHVWFGPRQPEGGLAALAAAIFIEKDATGDEVVARVTVKNVGCGHAIPTGEPLRALLLGVEAFCDSARLAPSGGDAVPDFGGYEDRKTKGEDWSIWAGAKPGDVVRVVRRPGAFHDYAGFGRFGDGSFSPAQKGMPVEIVAGAREIVAVNADNVVFDAPLPEGDIAYRAATSTARAGSAGFGFARVLAGADGRRMIPHFLAADVRSDNRLLPQASFTTEHRFTKTCADPEIRAVLIHRALPLELARERKLVVADSVIAEARR